jgi:hypothetical protein
MKSECPKKKRWHRATTISGKPMKDDWFTPERPHHKTQLCGQRVCNDCGEHKFLWAVRFSTKCEGTIFELCENCGERMDKEKYDLSDNEKMRRIIQVNMARLMMWIDSWEDSIFPNCLLNVPGLPIPDLNYKMLRRELPKVRKVLDRLEEAAKKARDWEPGEGW